MRVLTVFAHPEPRSFCGALKDEGVARLRELGHEVTESDLYRQGFHAVGGAGDFARTETADPFDYQAAQRRASAEGGYAADIADEQRKLTRADVLMLTFPMWWFGPPAILKGWIDRVMSVGFAYDSDRRFEDGFLRGRRGLVTVTTGSPAARFAAGGDRAYASLEDTLMPLHHGLFTYVGITPMPPFAAHAPARIAAAARQDILAAYRRHLDDTIGPA